MEQSKRFSPAFHGLGIAFQAVFVFFVKGVKPEMAMGKAWKSLGTTKINAEKGDVK